jgi:hypothetical protein
MKKSKTFSTDLASQPAAASAAPKQKEVRRGRFIVVQNPEEVVVEEEEDAIKQTDLIRESLILFRMYARTKNIKEKKTIKAELLEKDNKLNFYKANPGKVKVKGMLKKFLTNKVFSREIGEYAIKSLRNNESDDDFLKRYGLERVESELYIDSDGNSDDDLETVDGGSKKKRRRKKRKKTRKKRKKRRKYKSKKRRKRTKRRRKH